MSLKIMVKNLGDKKISEEKINQIKKVLNENLIEELGLDGNVNIVLTPKNKEYTKEFYLLINMFRIPQMLSYNNIVNNPELAIKAQSYKKGINSLVNDIKKIKKELFSKKNNKKDS